MNINCFLFNDFETLDIFGPVEVFGKVEEYEVKYYSMNGGNIIDLFNNVLNRSVIVYNTTNQGHS
jgi:hypothetical protein